MSAGVSNAGGSNAGVSTAGVSTDVVDAVHRAYLATDSVDSSEVGRLGLLDRLLDQHAPLASPDQRQTLSEQLWARIAGLGPLDELLADTAVADIMVNSGGRVWLERDGVVTLHPQQIDGEVLAVLIERILAPLGRRVDRSSPIVDARLPDGSRVCIVVPPIAIDGPMLTIRRFRTRHLQLEDFAGEHLCQLLRHLVAVGANVVVSGGTGAGKTSLLNALASALPASARVVTIEDTAELQVAVANLVRLETRPATNEGVRAIVARELVRAALRLRPDRIIVGEIRGPEALDMLQAMNTGHAGSLSTVHANGGADALRRLETLSLFGGNPLPIEAVRAQISSAVDAVVHVQRGTDGARRVASISEVDGHVPGTGWQLHEVERPDQLRRPARLTS